MEHQLHARHESVSVTSGGIKKKKKEKKKSQQQKKLLKKQKPLRSDLHKTREQLDEHPLSIRGGQRGNIDERGKVKLSRKAS